MSDLGKLYKTVKVDLLAADTTRTLIAAPSGGADLRDQSSITVYRIVYISKTSGAQAITVDIGTVNILDLADSITAHVIIDTGWLDGGLKGDVETALIAVPAAAAPAGSFFVTYSID